MTAIIQIVCKILGPIIDMIFKGIAKAQQNKKDYEQNIKDFQTIQHASLSEEERALNELNKKHNQDFKE